MSAPMLARRLAVVAIVAAVIALVAFLVMRDDGTIERRELASDASVDSPSTAHTDLAATANNVERAAAVPQEASDAIIATQTMVRTFAQLVRPYAGDTRDTLVDATIVCTTAAGVQRRARLDDDVLASDLAPDGLWVVTAPDYLPAVFDPNHVAALAPDARQLPLVLELLPRAEVTLQLDVPATDGLAINDPPTNGIVFERLALARVDGNDVVPDWIVADPPRSKNTPEPLNAVAIDVVRLAEGVGTPAEAALHVARIRATPLGTWGTESSIGYLEQDEHAEQLWSPRFVTPPIGERVTFDHAVAGEELAFIAFGLAPLVFTRADGTPLASFARRGAVGTAPFELQRGESREYVVRHVAPARVRGRFPAATVETATPSLWCEQPTAHRARIAPMSDACDPPGRDVDGSFEWAGLDPGHYSFYAEWEETGAVSRRVHLEFELRAGEVRDLGELHPAANGRLTLHPRLVSADALAAGIEPSNFTAQLVVSGPFGTERASDAGHSWPSLRRLDVEFGEPCVVDGIELGTYHIVVRSFRVKRPLNRLAPSEAKVTALLAALKSGTDPRLYKPTSTEQLIVVEVGEDTSLDVVVEVAAAGACTVVVPLDTHDAQRWHEGQVEFIRRDGLDRQPGEIRIVEVSADGTSASTTAFLPPGEWLAIVAYDVMKERARSAVSSVASLAVTITSGAHSEHTLALEPAARLRVAIEFDPYTTPRLADLGDREHVGVTLRPSASGSVFDGLLPNMRYRFGEDVIETGAPGSEVVLE